MMSTSQTSSISSDFLNDLKTRTADSHKKLESLPVSVSILSPQMKLNDYSHYLSLMHDVHNSTEKVIFPMLSEIVGDLEERKKKNLIEKDLSYLNYNKSNAAFVFENTDMTIPFALGVLYVIEGSSLGGRFILKNVTTVSELSNGQGVDYFNGYGDKTGSYWKSFISLLAEYEQEYKCGNSIIEGAVYAFDSIYNHFQRAEKG